MQTKPVELEHSRQSAKSYIDLLEPHKLLMVYGYMTGITTTPELDQLHETNNALVEFQKETKKNFSRLKWMLISAICSLSAGIGLGLDVNNIIEIVIWFWEYILKNL